MQHLRPLFQLILARLREFFRQPEAIFWVYGFPLILAVGLGIAFGSRAPDMPAVDVQRTPNSMEADALAEQLRRAGMDAQVRDEADCRQRLRIGKTTLFIVPSADGYRYVYDSARTDSVTARYRVDAAVQRWKAGTAAWTASDTPTSEPGQRYIDFLLPGLIGMNLMGGGLWGVGFVLVDMRTRKLLKRLLATPMHRSDFLLSLLGARLAFLVPEMIVLTLVGHFGFQVPLGGHLLTLGLVMLSGAVAFAGLGLLTACRADKIETITGVINLVALPMWLLSGTFFSSRRFPDAAQPVIQALPLTQLNDALREVMLEGATLAAVAWRLAILAVWAGLGFVLALRWFRWQ
jgi:ABC-type multidrug transport system permease subunit